MKQVNQAGQSLLEQVKKTAGDLRDGLSKPSAPQPAKGPEGSSQVPRQVPQAPKLPSNISVHELFLRRERAKAQFLQEFAAEVVFEQEKQLTHIASRSSHREFEDRSSFNDPMFESEQLEKEVMLSIWIGIDLLAK